jgi:dTDP-4-amino-4,6-dideoxygalactose transaminase
MPKKLAVHGGIPVRADFLVFGQPHFEKEEIREVIKTIRSCWVGKGPKVSLFENLFSQYIGARHSVALNSCTAGLHLSMLASGLKPGDEVLTTPLTFCATANSIIHAGCIPVFADIDRVSMNIDPEEIEKKITNKSKAIVYVHMAGHPCNIDALLELARLYNLILIGDCAHAIEAEYKGKKVGSYGDINAFSFYVTKNLVTVEG